MLIVSGCLAAMHAFPVAGADEKGAGEFYEQAVLAFDGGDIAAAVIHLKNALRAEPGYVAAHVLLGRAYLRQGDAAAAENELRRALELGADRRLIIVPLARSYLLQGRYRDLLDEFPVGRLPASLQVDLLTLRGDAHVALGQVEEAEEAYRRANRLAPNALEPLLGLVNLSLGTGNLKQAEGFLEAAHAVAPDNAKVWYLRGMLKHARGVLKEALKDYQKAIELDDDYLDAALARIGIRLDLGQNQEALMEAEALEEQYPHDPRVVYLQAQILQRLGQEEKAKQALLEALNIIDGLPPQAFEANDSVRLLAALVNYSLGQFQKAQDHLALYIRRHPGRAGPRRLMGAILLAMGEYQRAIDVLEPLATADSRDHRLLSMLGTAYLRMNREVLAEEYLARALAINPAAAEPRFQMALGHLGSGRLPEAIANLEQVFAHYDWALQAGRLLVKLHLRQGRPEQAQAVARKMVERLPESAEAFNLLGVTRLDTGDIAGARAAFEKAAKLAPHSLVPRVNLARVDLASGRADTAIARLEEILQKNPRYVRAMIELGRIQAGLGNLEHALRWLRKAHNVDPSSIQAKLYLVEVLLQAGETAEAVEVARQAVAQDENNLAAQLLLGKALLAADQSRKAAMTLKEAARKAGFNVSWLERIARLQLAAGDLDNAIWSLQKASEEGPERFSVRALLVEAWLRANRLEPALQEARSLVQDFPEEGRAHRVLGDVQWRRGQPGEAEQAYRAALSRTSSPMDIIRLARAQLAMGEDARALRTLEGWLESHPDEVVVKVALAETQVRLGRLAIAEALFAELVEARPEDALLLNNLASLKLLRGKPDEALPLARRAVALAGRDPAVGDTLGWALVQTGQAEEGLRHLRNAFARAAGDPAIRYHIAVALSRLGRTTEAVTELRAALSSKASFLERPEAERLLKSLTQ